MLHLIEVYFNAKDWFYLGPLLRHSAAVTCPCLVLRLSRFLFMLHLIAASAPTLIVTLLSPFDSSGLESNDKAAVCFPLSASQS